MKKAILTIGVALVVSGCVIRVESEPKTQPVQPPIETRESTTPTTWKPNSYEYESPAVRQAKEDYCNIKYMTNIKF